MSCGVGPLLFEPIHGSAPQLAGQNRACPIGAILCVSTMLRETFGLEMEAGCIETAIDRVLAQGYRTPDIAAPDNTVVGCSDFVALVRKELQQSLKHAERYGWGV